MSDAAKQPVPALDTKTLLARINERIAMLRSWISHDHRDEPFWWARDTTPPRAQSDRQRWRFYAHLIHVERANARGRLHSTRFASLEEQASWLAQYERHDLPCGATLVSLRAR
jgi:hypothetical protein